jgi:hypothetical protein
VAQAQRQSLRRQAGCAYEYLRVLRRGKHLGFLANICNASPPLPTVFARTARLTVQRHEKAVRTPCLFAKYLSVSKIALPVRFAEVKGEAAEPAYRREIPLNAAGGHVAKRTGSAIHRSSKSAKHQTTKKRSEDRFFCVPKLLLLLSRLLKWQSHVAQIALGLYQDQRASVDHNRGRSLAWNMH